MALPIYYSHGRTKYQYTTLLLLVKTEALLPKLQAFRLKWNRFCNTKGRKGHNISLDLRLEQLNNLLKSFLKVLGSNLSLSSAQRVACCLDVLEAILESIDADCSMHKDNKQRQCKDKAETVLQIVKDLMDKIVLFKTPGRKGYNSFSKISHNVITKLDYRDFYAWIKDKLKIWENNRIILSNIWQSAASPYIKEAQKAAKLLNKKLFFKLALLILTVSFN